MPFPERIQAKISSEAAGSISITPVVRQEMSAAELMENIVRVTGKNAARVREVLRQGTVVSGASRFRWAPIEVLPEELDQALQSFPDPQPGRSFDASRCVRARLTGGRAAIDLDREAASRKGWFARRSFWQALMETAGSLPLTYHNYSYADHADVYFSELPLEAARALRSQARLLRYSSLETAVRDYTYNRLEFWVER